MKKSSSELAKLATSSEMASRAIDTSTCSTPGEKIRSQGQGQGLARGGGKGPMGRPKLTSSEIADRVLGGKKKAERT